MSRRKPAATKFKAKPTPALGHTPSLVTEPTPFQLFCEENGFTEKTVFVRYNHIGASTHDPYSAHYFLFESDTGQTSIYLRPILNSGKIGDQVHLIDLDLLARRTFKTHVSEKPNAAQRIDEKFKERGWDIYSDLFCYRWSPEDPTMIFRLASTGSYETETCDNYYELDPETGLFARGLNAMDSQKFYDVYHLPSSSPSAFDNICATNGWDPNGVFTNSLGNYFVVQWDTGYNLIFLRRVDMDGNPLDEIYKLSVLGAYLTAVLTQKPKDKTMPTPGIIPRAVRVDLTTTQLDFSYLEMEGQPDETSQGKLVGYLEGHHLPYLVELRGERGHALVGFPGVLEIKEERMTALQLRALLKENPNMVWSYDKIKASDSWFSDITMEQCWVCYNYTGTESDVWEKA